MDYLGLVVQSVTSTDDNGSSTMD